MKNISAILRPTLLTTIATLSACGGDTIDTGVVEVLASDPIQTLTDIIADADVSPEMDTVTDTSNANSTDSSGDGETVFNLADTSWASKCSVEGTTPGYSQVVVWEFTTTNYVNGPYLYDGMTCEGELLSDVVYGGRYEITGNVTTSVDGKTVYEFEQYISAGAAIELPVQTLWLHMDGGVLTVFVNTERGVELDEETPVFYRQ